MTMKTKTVTGLPHHLRIAALQCNFEGGEAATLAMPARWRELGFNVEQLFHTHSEKYNALYRAEAHAGLLRRYVAECRRNGIQILLYLNCHILLESQAERSRDWAQVDRKGEFLRPYGTYYGASEFVLGRFFSRLRAPAQGV